MLILLWTMETNTPHLVKMNLNWLFGKFVGRFDQLAGCPMLAISVWHWLLTVCYVTRSAKARPSQTKRGHWFDCVDIQPIIRRSSFYVFSCLLPFLRITYCFCPSATLDCFRMNSACPFYVCAMWLFRCSRPRACPSDSASAGGWPNRYIPLPKKILESFLVRLFAVLKYHPISNIIQLLLC